MQVVQIGQLATRQRAVGVADQDHQDRNHGRRDQRHLLRRIRNQDGAWHLHDRGVHQSHDGDQHTGPSPGNDGSEHHRRYEEDEGDARVGDWKNRPMHRGHTARRWPQRQIVAAWSFRSTATTWRCGVRISGAMADRVPPARPASEVTPSAGPNARFSGHRRWLPGVLRQSLIDPGPFGAWVVQIVAPGLSNSGVIQRAIANDDEVWALFGLAEQVSATLRTEAPMHHIAAVGHAAIVGGVPSMVMALLGNTTLTVALPAPGTGTAGTSTAASPSVPR